MTANLPMEALYETDPYLWSLGQAEALRDLARTGAPPATLDLRHLIEELDGMAANDRQRVEKLAVRIVERLTFIACLPTAPNNRHWQVELVEVQDQLEAELTPTLESHLQERLPAVIQRGRKLAGKKLEIYEESAGLRQLPGVPAPIFAAIRGLAQDAN